MKKEGIQKIALVTLFAIAMAFLECAIVVYIRRIFYDGGFGFPLKGFLDLQILSVEWIREFFTIVMLAAVAFIAGKKSYERFAYFIYAFAVWDIFYYVWLKATLGWPASLLTWDVLFLIPWAWVGPVLAPLVVSITFIALAFAIFKKDRKMKISEWALFILGMLVILYTFLIDYGKLLFTNPELMESYVPVAYNWFIFAIGEALAVCGIVKFYLIKK